MKKITWAKGWGIIQYYEDGCLITKLCHYGFLKSYTQGYNWHGISLEQYQAIRSGKETIEKIWNDVN